MSLLKLFALAASVTPLVSAYDPQLAFSTFVETETRSIDEIHQASLKEGGVVTVWHGGDETTQLNGLKPAKYHDINLDQQLATESVYVDSTILQTFNDFPRWKSQGVLLPYKPLGFDSIFDDFKDLGGYYTGFSILEWTIRSRLFDALLTQRPRWVRGAATPGNILRRPNGTYLTTFTSQFVTWPQTGAILKDAQHQEGAKLLHNYMLSQERVTTPGSMWSVRKDIAPPAGYPNFSEWMMDRAAVERLRFFFEDKIGSAQGLSALIADL
ncbi:hypothetical protein DL98DRAFT_548682 [Cadophora sp. DSE1049]|nr:hypothetical protein DL98DRAFT_548682 [Cadophora sp. DSE1049]